MSRANDPFDTYLLRVFSILMNERSVSRAATRLNQSQPAVSTALKRLREIFDDPLLIKDKQRMVPTERALQLEASVRVVLGEIDALLSPGDLFDPATTRQTFRIGTPDYLAPPLMAAVVQYLRTTAPGARMLLQPLGPDYDYDGALADGEIDVVIGNWPQPPEQLHLSILLEDELVCLMSKRHPLAGKPLTVDAYLAARHVVPLSYSVAQRGVVDTRLANLRVERDARVVVQSFNLAPYMLVDTDLVFTTSRHFAQFYVDQLPLVIAASPIDFPRMRFYQLWHERTHHSPAHRWLRTQVSAAGQSLR